MFSVVGGTFPFRCIDFILKTCSMRPEGLWNILELAGDGFLVGESLGKVASIHSLIGLGVDMILQKVDWMKNHQSTNINREAFEYH